MHSVVLNKDYLILKTISFMISHEILCDLLALKAGVSDSAVNTANFSPVSLKLAG